MINNWPVSPILMLLSFPLLCGALMLLVHGTVQFIPRTIREHHVTYRPIRSQWTDLKLIVKLALSRKAITKIAPLPHAGYAAKTQTRESRMPLSSAF
jgi:hypothetical protein